MALEDLGEGGGIGSRRPSQSQVPHAGVLVFVSGHRIGREVATVRRAIINSEDWLGLITQFLTGSPQL